MLLRHCKVPRTPAVTTSNGQAQVMTAVHRNALSLFGCSISHPAQFFPPFHDLPSLNQP